MYRLKVLVKYFFFVCLYVPCTYWPVLIGTPVHAIIQSGNHVAALECIKSVKSNQFMFTSNKMRGKGISKPVFSPASDSWQTRCGQMLL